MRPARGGRRVTDRRPDSQAFDVLAAIETAFGHVSRPEHFTDYRHCCECFEHDETLRVATPDTIGLAELGNPGWDPICFVSVEGFHYYMPALARLALGRGQASYVEQFLFHLQWPPDRIERMNQEQRSALRQLLAFIFDTMFEDIDDLDREMLVRLLSLG